MSKERLKKIAGYLILLAWLIACIVSVSKAFGVKPVLAAFGMGVFLVSSIKIIDWAWTTLFGEYTIHHGADPP